MLSRLKVRLWIWMLDHDLLTVEPWRDPRRSATDRALWLEAKPKSLDSAARDAGSESPAM